MIVNQFMLYELILQHINPQWIVLTMTTSKNSKEDEERILNALRSNPELKDCILEMIDIDPMNS